MRSYLNGMIQEHSYGIIPLQKVGEGWQVLLVCHHAGHWGFPKGHGNEGEEPDETAQRELFEETGLTVSLYLFDEPLEDRYRFRSSSGWVGKTVSYFVAEVEGNIVLQSSEIIDSRWVKLQEADKHLTFPEAKALVKKVIELLSL